MAKFIPQLFMLACLVVLTACSPISTPGVDSAAATAAYETEVSVLVTQAFATLQAVTPQASATPSLTPQPPATPTPVAPLISVSVDTNCRRGPGQVYDYLGGLMVGETAQILGRDPSGLYWYIRNPDQPGYCWVWGHYATIVGNTGPLPVFTPEPTPTPVPNFTFAYSNLNQCSGNYGIEFSLNNTGMMYWESFTLIVRNVTHTLSNTYSDNQFADAQGCGAVLEGVRLAPAQTWIIGSMPFMNFDPTGDSFTADLKMCSLDNQTGVCLTKTISFTP